MEKKNEILKKTKFTTNIDDRLLTAIKKCAIDEKKDVNEILEILIQKHLLNQSKDV